MDLDLDSLLRMIAAVVFGGAIGFNRDIYGKPTGIRAHALVSLGAALLVLAGSGNYIGGNHPDAMSRVIQGIVTGVGFLGAGAILKMGDREISGLTTAASIWLTAPTFCPTTASLAASRSSTVSRRR